MMVSAYRQTYSPSRLAWSEGWRPLDTVMHSSHEPSELAQWRRACLLSRSPGKVKLTGMQKKGFKSDWLGHAKRVELDESALNTTKTSKVRQIL